MKRKASKRGIIFIAIGLFLLILAGGWYLCNTIEDHNAGKQASSLLTKLEEQQITSDSSIVTVEGEAFCGTVLIEKLDIKLPVFEEWDYERLKTAPCRYSGGADTNDLIIAAHNYKSHFGDLKKLQIGDEIVFSDVSGKRYYYAVKELTVLDGTAVSEMRSGEWDFTLFTCTKGGKQRVTVRCESTSDMQ